MSNENNVSVEIFNHRFRLASDSKDADYIQRAAAYLDEKMKQAAVESGKKSAFDIAILAAMEIAEEVMDERAKTEHLLNQADERINSVTERLKVKDNENNVSDVKVTEDDTPSKASGGNPAPINEDDARDELNLRF